MITNPLKSAWRRLKRNFVFSITNMVGLAIGLACCLLIMLYVFDEVGYDRFHRDFSRIYRLTLTETDSANMATTHTSGNSALPIGALMQEHLLGMENFVRIARQTTPCVLKVNDDLFFETSLYADANFFTFFSFPLVAGSSEGPLNHPNSAVVTEDIAIRYFGTMNVLGKPLLLQINDSLNTFFIRAVVKNVPARSSIAFGIVLPMEFFERNIATGCMNSTTCSPSRTCTLMHRSINGRSLFPAGRAITCTPIRWRRSHS